MTIAQLLKIAVIGAGTSGLTTARELKRDGEGHEIVIFEKDDKLGGTWVYNPEIEADPLGLDPNRKIVHSSLYNSLRTNLPTSMMGFSDYPFSKSKSGKPNCYHGREEVLEFLNKFAQEFGLLELIRFNTEVVRVELDPLVENQWVVEWREKDQSIREEKFDAVVVGNGHYTQPRLGELPGIEKWPGKQIHSHNYRVPEPFRDQAILIIGYGPSTFDIATETSKLAKGVHVATRGRGIKEAIKMPLTEEIWIHSEVENCCENGEVTFKDGSSATIDTIIHCTGYNYTFPFLKTNGIVSNDDRRIGPLYKHVFPPELAPRLSFVGIPRRCINFLMIDLQAKWVARVLCGKAVLPSKEEMLADVEEYYKQMEQDGVPKHHTHSLPLDGVGDYLNFLSTQIGKEPKYGELAELFVRTGKETESCFVGFRERIEKWL